LARPRLQRAYIHRFCTDVLCALSHRQAVLDREMSRILPRLVSIYPSAAGMNTGGDSSFLARLVTAAAVGILLADRWVAEKLGFSAVWSPALPELVELLPLVQFCCPAFWAT
jgi:hypothetical protein